MVPIFRILSIADVATDSNFIVDDQDIFKSSLLDLFPLDRRLRHRLFHPAGELFLEFFFIVVIHFEYHSIFWKITIGTTRMSSRMIATASEMKVATRGAARERRSGV